MPEATCTRCGETKPEHGFYRHPAKRNGLASHCKSCVRDYQRRNHGRRHAQVTSYLARHREAVFEHLGGKCAHCGVTERLALDHVNNDGAQHRKEPGVAGPGIFTVLVRNNFECDYELQLLCPNCHWDKTYPSRAGTQAEPSSRVGSG